MGLVPDSCSCARSARAPTVSSSTNMPGCPCLACSQGDDLAGRGRRRARIAAADARRAPSSLAVVRSTHGRAFTTERRRLGHGEVHITPSVRRRSRRSGRTAGTTARTSVRTSGSGRASASRPRPRSRATTRCGRGLLERRGPLDRDAADTRVLEREPAQDARHATGLLRLLERRVAQPGRVEQELEQRALRRGRRRRRARATPRSSAPSSSIGRVDELPRVLERQAPAALARGAAGRRRAGRGSAAATRPRASSRAPTRAVATRCHAASAASRSRGSSTPRSASRGPIRASSTMR